MNNFYTGVKREIAQHIADILNVDEKLLQVEDTDDKFDADVAVPLFRFAGEQQTSPQELADRVASQLSTLEDKLLKSSGEAGFVNIWLNPVWVAEQIRKVHNWEHYGNNDNYSGQQILVEHTDPNPFKEIHIGHVYSNTIGESLARLHEASGAKVHRISYHGDVGLHIGKAIWAIGEEIGWDASRVEKLQDPIGAYYAMGNEAYEQDESKQLAIRDINQKIYSREDDTINAIYDWGRAKSFAAFDDIYKQLDVQFEKMFFESESGSRGLVLVRNAVGTIFEESDGAVVYRGEQDGLHTRVFINSEGLPTYEAKDLGLMQIKDETYPQVTRSIIVTAHEINEYFKVVLAAMKRLNQDLAEKTVHLSHGMVRLPEGKMSSRTGSVVKATDLLEEIEATINEKAAESPAIHENSLAAIKYAFLKPKIGNDIVFDVEESINLEGQTGPYVQYAAVRAQSIIEKAKPADDWGEYNWQAERKVLILLARYPEIVNQATHELHPHTVAQFVYDLARELNRYYEQVNVKDAADHERAARLTLLHGCVAVLRHGLHLLGISTPAKM